MSRRFSDLPRLRDPGRVAILEVDRVVALCREGLTARSVLDVGTGTGLFAEAFAEQGLEVAGIDVNPKMVEAAQRYVPQARFDQAPAEAIPFPDGAFDLVLLGLVLHETDDPLRALAEARRVARDRVSVLEWPYQEGRHGPPLAHRLTSEQVADLARSAGLQAMESLPLTHIVLYRLDL